MSNIQVIPVRIKILGPQWWQCIVEDAETGKRLPVLIDEQAAFAMRVEDGCWVADVRLIIHEVDATMPARATEVIEAVSEAEAAYIEKWDPAAIVRRPTPGAPAETVDDFAARTVSLIMEPK